MAVFSIVKKGKKKKWAADWYDGIDRHRREFKTKAEAEDFEAIVRTQKRDGVYIPVEKIPLFKDVAAKAACQQRIAAPWDVVQRRCDLAAALTQALGRRTP